VTTNFAASAVDGRLLPVIAEYPSHHWSARVLYRVEASAEWELHWTDGINVWIEHYDYPWHALARLAALVAAVEQDVFLVHRSDDPHGPLDFVAEAERFVSRTIHASGCRPNCDGTDPVNHQV
jgi:hypothetical protein